MNISKIASSVSAMALAALSTTVAHARAGVVLNVNDTNPVGSTGDSLLSLDEAVRVANGTLALGSLSPAERAQVKGTPGNRSGDLITLPKGATLTVAKGAAVSPLVGNDGDTIDGNGAMLESGDAGKGTALKVASSNFTLRNIRGKGFSAAVEVDFGGRKLTNVTLERLHLSSTLNVGATTSNGSLRGLTVADSVFDTEGRSGIMTLIYIRAGTAMGADTTVENVLLDGVRFVRNQITGGGLGIYLTGSVGNGRMVNAVTRNVVMADNVFTGQDDAAINLLGALSAGGGHHTKVGLENVVATGNRVEAANWGFYMGNENFGAWMKYPAGSMRESFLRNLTVTKNTIVRNAKGAVGHCITLENGADFRADLAIGNVIENVKITDNEISGCVELARRGRAVEGPGLGAGIYVNAGRASLGSDNSGGVARNNVARNVEIRDNRIKDSTRGIVVNGGYNRFPGKAPELAEVTGNSFTGLRIEGNQLENTPTGIRITAGDAAAGATVTGNSVRDVTIRGNRITGARIVCETIANAGSAAGNTLDAKCPATDS